MWNLLKYLPLYQSVLFPWKWNITLRSFLHTAVLCVTCVCLSFNNSTYIPNSYLIYLECHRDAQSKSFSISVFPLYFISISSSWSLLTFHQSVKIIRLIALLNLRHHTSHFQCLISRSTSFFYPIDTYRSLAPPEIIRPTKPWDHIIAYSSLIGWCDLMGVGPKISGGWVVGRYSCSAVMNYCLMF